MSAPGAVDIARVGRGAIADIAESAGVLVATSFADNMVALIDPSARTIRDIPVDGEPFAVVVADDRAYVALSAAEFDGVAVIDLVTGSEIATYPLASGVSALAVSPDGKRVFAGRATDTYIDVAVIDVTADRIGTIEIATGPAISIDALAVDHTGRRLYVATTDEVGSQLVVVDTETARVRNTIVIGAPIRCLALGPDNTAYVLTSDLVDRGEVYTVDLASGRATGRVSVGDAPTQLVVGADGTRAYVVDYDRVTVFCTQTGHLVDVIEAYAQPSCVAVSQDGARLYVADCAGEITAVEVTAPQQLLYSQFMATKSVGMPEVRALEAAAI
ncbi:YncE family protein [Mycobacterium sp. OTB74]|uniref:YncE family protein n=1 Tax=Mycobacterium sp. OTB74 TaxID=1853452 RepID=UPI0024739B10|nr:YncE family protein [Mycobacterium sp. OTB74]MDH6247123.1 DNA-binding beta-propeller fold protein YncE [Mycobacterium sp. OTB74]